MPTKRVGRPHEERKANKLLAKIKKQREAKAVHSNLAPQTGKQTTER